MPNVACLRQHSETVAHQNAILTAQRSNVGNGCERNQIQHCPDERIVFPELFRERECKLERDSDSREILVGILTTFLSWIQDSEHSGRASPGKW
jgi:hypothetical protein